MIRLFKSFAAKLWLSVVLVVILGGILTGAGRLFTPLLSEFKTELSAIASQALGQPVELRSLRARWGAWGPEIIMRDVYLKHPETGKKTLQVAEVDVALSLLESLKAGAVIPRHVTLIGVKLAVRLEKEGRLTIRGLDQFGEGEGDSSRIFLLPGRLSVEKSEISWENRAMAGPPIVFSDVNLHLMNDGDRHQLKGNLQLADYKKGRISLALDILGDTLNSADWSGEAYLKGESFPLARLLSHRLPKQYTLLNGLGEFEVWGSLRSATLADLTGRVNGTDILIERQVEADSAADSLLQIDSVGGSFQLRQSEQGWDFLSRGVLLERDGSHWPLGRIELSARRDDSGDLTLRAGNNYLPLELIDSIARFIIPPDHELQQRLYAIAPEGNLKGVRVRLVEKNSRWAWSVKGDISRLTTNPWGGIPGVDNLSLHLALNQSSGEITLDTEKGALYFETLFRDPLLLDELRGRISWALQDDGGWSLNSERIIASNADIRTQSRGSLIVPASSEQSSFLDLQTDFSDGKLSTISRYLPVEIMPERVVEWLDSSIVEGRVISGGCLVRGPLRDFPFEQSQTGRFEVLFDTEALKLDYWPDWPAIHNIAANVRFLNNRFDAWVSDGSIFENRINRAHARIESLGRAPLELDGRINGALNDGLQFLRDSPLREKFGPLLPELSGKGDFALDLAMAVPLNRNSAASLSGEFSFLGSSLSAASNNLAFTDIDGAIKFDQDRLWSETIHAKLFGRRIEVDLKDGVFAESTELSAQGIFAVNDLLRGFQPTELEWIKGEAPWRFELEIPHKGSPHHGSLSARLYSDLKGISIDLPEPFRKSVDEPRRVQITSDLAPRREPPLTLRYGTLLSAYLLLGKGDTDDLLIEGASIQLGGRMAKRPESADMNIRGELEVLDLSEFSLADDGTTLLPPLKRVDIGIGKLQLMGFEIDAARINVDRGDNAWIGVYNSDQGDGSIRIPFDTDHDRIQLRLSRLNIEKKSDTLPEPDGLPSKPSPPTINPETLPLLDLNIDRLSINNHLVGALSASTARHPGGLELTSLMIDGEDINLTLYGTWRNRTDALQETAIGFKLNSDGVGPLLSSLDLYRDLDKAPAEIEGRLTWLGSPLDFDYRHAEGKIALQVGEGHLLELKPGLGRVLGLLNISAINRRLTLDFSDLLKQGLAFDSIEGNIRLDGEDAFTNDLIVSGPSSKIDLSGRTGLTAEDLDYLVTVTPRISSTIPLAGTIAGGPVVGAALLVAQQLVGKQVDAAIRLQYSVKGPWSDPEVTRSEPARDASQENPLDQLGSD